jgi:hypothetical protein
MQLKKMIGLLEGEIKKNDWIIRGWNKKKYSIKK